MFASLELRDTEAHPSLFIGAEGEVEIVVEDIGHLCFSVDNEFDVMPYTAPHSVDTIIVAHLCHEIRSAVDRSAIDE